MTDESVGVGENDQARLFTHDAACGREWVYAGAGFSLVRGEGGTATRRSVTCESTSSSSSPNASVPRAYRTG